MLIRFSSRTKKVAAVERGAEFIGTVNPNNGSDIRRMAKALGGSEDFVYRAATEALASSAPVERELPDAEPAKVDELRPVSVTVRGLNFAHGQTFPDLHAAFKHWPFMDPEPLILWSKDDLPRLAALDVDWHTLPYDMRPAEEWLRALVSGLEPRPAYAWRTHGNGLRGIYFAAGGFGADELAACAGLAVKLRDKTCTFEIKTVTRHPAYPNAAGRRCSDVWTFQPTTDAGPVKSFFGGQPPADAVDAWLEESGLARGQKYTHDDCPENPGHSSHGEPVWVGDEGIHCKSCAKLFPWSALVPGAPPRPLFMVVNNCCHWEHARHVLTAAAGLTGDVARATYGAMLKLCHGPDDKRIPKAFAAGRDLIRLQGRWTNADASLTYQSASIAPMLATLPATHVDDKPCASLVNRFQTAADLATYGYPALSPVRGFPIFGHWLQYNEPDRIDFLTQSKALRHDSCADRRPKYAHKDQRDVDDAWRTIEEVFPGIERNYLRLLIAAKGCSEGRVGLPPLILVQGPSGAAKSGTVMLAASICGDHCTDVIYGRDEERFRQGALDGIDNGSFVAVNEIFKSGRSHRKTPRETMDVVLNLTEDSVSHKLYTGPVALGRVPVIVFTDTYVPQEVRDDTQLARRLVLVSLPRRVDWEETLASSGVLQIERFRVHDRRFAVACDAVLSSVVDDFFIEPRTLKDIAAELGYCCLEAAEDFDDPDGQLRALFGAVCQSAAAPRPPGDNSPGYVRVVQGAADDVSEAWAAVADTGNWYDSRRAKSADWARTLGVAEPVNVDVRHGKEGGTILVRFRTGGKRSPRAINGAIERPSGV